MRILTKRLSLRGRSQPTPTLQILPILHHVSPSWDPTVLFRFAGDDLPPGLPRSDPLSVTGRSTRRTGWKVKRPRLTLITFFFTGCRYEFTYGLSNQQNRTESDSNFLLRFQPPHFLFEQVRNGSIAKSRALRVSVGRPFGIPVRDTVHSVGFAWGQVREMAPTGPARRLGGGIILPNANFGQTSIFHNQSIQTSPRPYATPQILRGASGGPIILTFDKPGTSLPATSGNSKALFSLSPRQPHAMSIRTSMLPNSVAIYSLRSNRKNLD